MPESVYEIRHLAVFPYPRRIPPRSPDTSKGSCKRLHCATTAELAVDSTGVGAAVVDVLRDAGLSFRAVVITAGERESKDGSVYRVPKRNLVSAAQVLLQNRRVRISAALPEARTLTEELVDYRLKQNIATGHVGFEPWREGQHDDLVLALCLAIWAAERRSPPVVPMLVDTSYLPFQPLEELPFPPLDGSHFYSL